jgi:phenylpropionate dioxygenase-like ring-hydroxylating dioxygenase large terminal subunit
VNNPDSIEGLLEKLDHWRSNSDSVQGKLPMPPGLYTSAEILALETKSIFGKAWLCVGHVSELKESGDYLTFDLVRHPVLVVRDRSGELRAYSNVCQHRSARLVNGSGNASVFVCPYHAWTYELSGKLRGAPHMRPEQVKDVCLNGLRIETWNGLIFVNLDRQAAPLAPRLELLQEHVGPFDFSAMDVVHSYDDEVNCNWKVLVENFCESYHVFKVHKTTLEANTPTSSVEVMAGGPGYNHHTMRCATSAATSPGKEDDREHLSCIYPGLTFAIRNNSAICLSIIPLSVNRLRFRAWVARDLRADGVTESVVQQDLQLVAAFMAEDKAINTGVQQGLASGAGNRGPLNDMEETNWQFGQYIANRLLG